jgi:hypothetical protein
MSRIAMQSASSSIDGGARPLNDDMLLDASTYGTLNASMFKMQPSV